MGKKALPRILIVEDDQTFRETVCEVLRRQGYRVKGARTLKKASKQIEKHNYALVLADVQLGQDTGLDVLKMTRQRRPTAKILMMSGLADSSVVHQALDSGAVQFLHKPFGANELIQAVHEALASDSSLRI